MWKILLWISAAFSFSVAMVLAPVQAAQQSSPSTPGREANGQNSAALPAASQERAKAIYGYDCSMCHGPMGRGKTDLGKDATGSVSDLTDPATVARLSDKELYDIILNGKGKMPGEKGRLKEDGVWSMVRYVRNLAKEQPTLAGNPTSH